ncbi:MAG TPA: hypothetical protein VJ824_00885 [Bacillota bacterium]|nr:hypothetical protein [Bacillota bacterium]
MKLISWAVGIGLLALAVVRWALPKQQKSIWRKAMGWTSGTIVPMSGYLMRFGRKMVRGMVK